MICDIKKIIAEALYNIIKKTTGETRQDNLSKEEIAGMIEYPPDINMGDLAFPCFRLSKIFRKSPNVIAETIAGEFTRDVEDAVPYNKIKNISCAGGYINFTLNDKYYIQNILNDIFEQKDKYGSSNIGDGKTAVIDYSSPNMSKPLGVAHMRPTNIGNSIKKIHQFCGYKMIAINYIGDWGTPQGKILAAYKLWCNDMTEIEEKGVYKLLDLYVNFGVEAEKDERLNDMARSWFVKLEQGDEEAVGLWKKFMGISVAEIKRIYNIMGIEFDSYDGESFFEDKMDAVVEELKEKNILKLDQGAQIVDLSEYNMPPCLILKTDGATLYPTRDIASAIYRKKTYNFDKNIYVNDMRQNLHFAQWIKVTELMGYDWANNCINIPFGLMNFGGQVMATRKGNTQLLDDLLKMAVEKVETIMEEKNPGDETLSKEEKKEIAKKVGIGAVMFGDLVNSRIKDVNFNWEEALNFNGNSGPYVQYTYARACSVLEKNDTDIDYKNIVITNNLEREIIKLLSQLPEKVLIAEREYEPSVICRYLLDICAVFNRFYHDCSILKAESAEIKNSRLALCEAVKYAIGNGLWLIGLEKTNKV
ncbi:MAG: arginine--tRNA ligase [Oscillospiraceae bacterium]|nr:arginine--tRNA ligase [Oscillospiraceae bacterium]